MASIDAAAVKKLREMTNAGIMDCKGALAEAEGDFERAATILREKGIASASKKAERVAADGSLGIYVSQDGKQAALVEVNCETDFVAKNDKFRELCREIATRAAESDQVSDAASLLALSLPSGSTVEQMIKEAIGTIGENIKIGRVTRLATDGFIGHYAHHDGKQGALVELAVEGANGNSGLSELGRDLATQVVAMRPQYVSREEIPTDVLDAEKNIYAQQAAADGKPEAIQQKIAEGRLSKEFYGTVCLLDQPFVKEQKKSVGQHVKEAASQAGAKLQVTRFVRYKVGEA